MPNVYEELLAAVQTVGFTPRRPAESTQEYLVRLIRAVYTVDDDAWSKLSEEAQSWYNQAADTANAGKIVDSCPGYDDPTARLDEGPLPKGNLFDRATGKYVDPVPQAEDSADEDDDFYTQPYRPKKKKKVKRARGVTDVVRELVILHPDWTTADFMAQLLKDGWSEDDVKIGTVSTLRTDTLATVKLVKQLGFWVTDAK